MGIIHLYIHNLGCMYEYNIIVDSLWEMDMKILGQGQWGKIHFNLIVCVYGTH